MIERTGNLFDTDCKIIGHGVNVDGKMGAGIAAQFRDKFPRNYQNYRNDCLNNMLHPGSLNGMVENGVVILNFASQDRPGAHAKYKWLFGSLYDGFVLMERDEGLVKSYGDTIAIPEIGCGIGGLEWPKAAVVIKTVEELFDYKFEFEVWHYDG